MAADSNSEHRGKGHAAYTESEAEDFIKERGVAVTSELAEEFGVSDVAIRKRLKESDRIGSRKVRNRRVWYVPHEPTTPEPDGYGGALGAVPHSGFYYIGAKTAQVTALAGVMLAGLHFIFGGSFLAASVVLLGVAVLAFLSASSYQDVADPSYSFKDLRNAIRGRR